MALPDRDLSRRRSDFNSQTPINVGLIGMGNVGLSVARFFQQGGGESHNIQLQKVAVANPNRPRALEVPGLTGDARDIFQDPNINIVIEVIGGTGRAGDFIFDAIGAGKNVVTANKAVIARNMKEIFDAARDNVDVGFEASVGGGIPIVDTLKGYQGQGIKRITGVLNGTTNFILSRMEEGLDFDTAVKIAQERGFAEADHSLDTGGYDTRDKLAILTSLAINSHVDPEIIASQGITAVTPVDLEFAAQYDGGHAVKLLAVADRQPDGEVSLRVNPALIKRDDPLAAVRDEVNGISLDGNLVGPLTMIGRGAGGEPTASAVLRDVFQVARNMRRGVVDDLPPLDSQVVFVPPGPTEGYLRVDLLDRAGSLDAASGVIADHGLSIKEIYVPDIITVHAASRDVIKTVLRELGNLNTIHERPLFMSIEK